MKNIDELNSETTKDQMEILKMKKNSTLENMNSRLHRAALNDDIKRIELMLQKGANIKDCLHNYNTIHWAVKNGHYEVVAFLVDNGELGTDDVNLEDADGKTALYYAVMQRDDEMVALLLDCGADETTVSVKINGKPWKEFFEERRKLRDAVIARMLGKEG